MLGLRCCVGFCLVVVPWLLIAAASLVAEHGLSGARASVLVALGLQSTGLIVVAVGPVALQHMGSPRIRDWTCDFCTGSGLFTTEPFDTDEFENTVAEKQLISDGCGSNINTSLIMAPWTNGGPCTQSLGPVPSLTHTHQQFLLSKKTVWLLCNHMTFFFYRLWGFYSKLLPHSIICVPKASSFRLPSGSDTCSSAQSDKGKGAQEFFMSFSS